MKFTGERFIPTDDKDTDIYIEHMHRYYSIINIIKGKTVVDGSCGEGYGSYLLSKYAISVIGIDISDETINHCKKKYQNDNLDYYVSDIVNSSFISTSSIDVYVSFETFEHIDSITQIKFIEEVKRVLKPDGILIISTPEKEVYNRFRNIPNEFHVHEVSGTEFNEILSKKFRYVKTYLQTFNLSNLIYSKDSQDLQIINEITDKNDAQYLICICSDIITNIDLSTIYFDNNNRYYNVMEYIIQKEDEIKELSNWGLSQDGEIINLRDVVAKYHSENNELNVNIIKLNTKLSNLQENLRLEVEKNKELNQKLLEQVSLVNNLMEEKESYKIELHNSNNKLNEKEERLNIIHRSKGYRFLQFLYRIINFILPINSKRRLLVRLLLLGISHPIKSLKYLRPKFLRNFVVNFFKKDPNALYNDIHRDINKLNIKNEYKIQPLEFKTYEVIEFPHYNNPTVSIIIPVYNQWNYTYSCLKSILENTKGVTYEIIIADDVSSDDTINIHKYIKNIKVNRNKQNLGFLLNCNDATKLAKGKYIHFLNNDTNVQPNWLDTLVEVMERNKNVGLVGSKLVYGNGQLQEAGGIIWNDASGWNYGRLEQPEKADFNYLKNVDYISGASIMIRRTLWEKIGGFDKRYVPAYFEDTDLAFEVRKQGFAVVYQPKSVIVHFEGISHGTDISGGIKKYQAINKEKFFTKWSEVLQNHLPNGQDVFLARDRSIDKKHILVIDHYVPHFDKDAGSKCTFHYLKLFQKLNFHITFLGDNFYPHQPYTDILQQMGINVLYGDWYFLNKDEWLIENSKYFNYIYLNRPHIAIKYIDLLKKHTKAKIIYFGHDLHYLRDARNYEIEQDPKLLESSDNWKKLELELFSKSDLIFAPGEYEAGVIKSLVPNKEILGIPIYVYDYIKKVDYHYKSRKDIMFVGGFGHKPNIDAVIWFTNKILPIIKEKLPDIKFFVIGSNPPDEILKLNSHDIIITGFISDDELEIHYKTKRLAISPLRYGAGVKGKNIEAIFNQIPLITSSIGAEGLPDIKDVILIADSESEFAEMIINTYLSPEKCRNISVKEYEYIKKHFTQESVIKRLEPYFDI